MTGWKNLIGPHLESSLSSAHSRVVVEVKVVPLETQPLVSSGFSVWFVTTELLITVHVLLMLCQFAKLFAILDLQRNLSSGIVLTWWFSQNYCKSTAGQTGEHPGYLVLLPRTMPLENLREALSIKWKRTLGMCKMWLNSKIRMYHKKNHLFHF